MFQNDTTKSANPSQLMTIVLQEITPVFFCVSGLQGEDYHTASLKIKYI